MRDLIRNIKTEFNQVENLILGKEETTSQILHMQI